MGNYLPIEKLCVDRTIAAVHRGQAMLVLAVMCHLAEPDGTVTASRETLYEGFGIAHCSFIRAVKVLVKAGVLEQGSEGRGYKGGWRRTYKLRLPMRAGGSR